MALITTTEARYRIPTLSSSAEDTLLGVLIAEAGRAFARWCGYPGLSPTMESASYTLYVDGPGGRDLYLPVQPVTAVSSIYDDSTLDFTSSNYLVSSSDYTLVTQQDGHAIVRLKSTSSWGIWRDGKGNIKAAVTAGFSTIPEDLKRLCAMAVRHAYDQRTTQGKRHTSSGGSSTGFDDAHYLPDEVREGLWQFRLPGAVA